MKKPFLNYSLANFIDYIIWTKENTLEVTTRYLVFKKLKFLKKVGYVKVRKSELK